MPSIKDDLYNLIFRDLQHKSLTNLTDEEVQLFFDTWVNTGVSGTSDVPVTLPQGVMYYDEEAKKLYIGQTDGSVQQLIALDDILKAENYNDDDMIIKKTISGIEVWSSITKADVRGFRRLFGLMSQSYDEENLVWLKPSIQTIENTVGTLYIPAITIIDVGVYSIRFASNVITNNYKAKLDTQVCLDDFGGNITGYLTCLQSNIGNDRVEFRTFNFAGTPAHGILSQTPFEFTYTP